MRAFKIVLIGAAVVASIVGLGDPASGSAAADPTGEFTSLTPARILDTRNGNGTDGRTTPIGTDSAIDVQVTGSGGVPETGVSAVVLNTTVVQVSGGGYLTVWPTGLERPVVSNLNPSSGQTVANQVTVKVGDGGRVSVYNALGEAHVIFDVAGYYTDDTGSAGARYKAVEPARLFDTRDGSGGVPAAPIGNDDTLDVKVTGAGGVPESGVTGVVMNVTATETTDYTYVTAYPGDQERPLASSLNLGPGTTVPNLVTVRVPGDGNVSFYNAVGQAHVLADVVGYYTTDVTTNEGRFVPMDPVRAYDTRDPGASGPLGEDEEMILYFGTNPGISALSMNVTAADATAPTYITVFPDDACVRPFASNLNPIPGQNVPNSVISRVSNLNDGVGCDQWDTAVVFYNAQGQVNVIVDLFGFFTDASEPAAARNADAGVPPSAPTEVRAPSRG